MEQVRPWPGDASAHTPGGFASRRGPLSTALRSLADGVDAAYTIRFLLVTAAYFGGAQIGYGLAFLDNATAVWPPAGLGVAVIALLGFRYLPAVMAGEALSVALSGMPGDVAAGQWAGNSLEAVVGGYVLNRLSALVRTPSLAQIAALALIVAPLAAALSASFVVTSMLAGDLIAPAEYGTVWVRWFAADVASIILFVPALAALLGRLGEIPRRSVLEVAGLGVALAAAAGASVLLEGHPTYLVFPPLVWAGLRFRVAGAAYASLAVTALILAAIAAGVGQIGEDPGPGALLATQAFIAIASLTALLIGVIDSERARASAEGERSRVEQRRAEARYRELVERLPAASYVAEPGAEGRWSYVSPQIERMLGYPAERWLADPRLWARCIHPEDRPRVIEAEEEIAPVGVPLASEYRMVAENGRVLWIRDEGILRTEPDGTTVFDGMLTDVTERKGFESQLQYLADHDPLTGLFNRRRFVEELDLEIKLVRRERHRSSLLMLDLDNFKYVNDSLGHRAGDTLISSIAELLRDRLRDTDTLSRLGGDEFAVLLRGTSPAAAAEVAEGLLAAIRGRTHALADKQVTITASAGLTGLDRDDAEELLAAADLGMYAAKHAGRDRLRAFSPELSHQAESGRSWAERIRAALDEDHFLLYAQPIVELASGRVVRHEILLRLRGEDDRIITPDFFLPLAERFDLIQQVDRWVARRTIELMGSRLAVGERLELEVNLSGKSIGDPELMDVIEGTLEETGVDAADLTFEVTETAAIANMDRAQAFSARLRRLGCRFALDDFGSGFASFMYLKHLPVDLVKIDGDFIRRLTSNPIDQEVVKAMIQITGALGQETVAEFVCDEETVELLRELGVDYGQGYYLGAPRPVGELSPVPA